MARSITQNFIALSVGRALSRVAYAFLLALVARVTSTASFGTFALALSVGDLLATGSDFGLGYLITRDVARNPGHAGWYVSNAVSLRLVLLAVCAFLGIPIIWAKYDRSVATALTLGMVAMSARSLNDMLAAVLNGFEEMRWSATIDVLTMTMGVGAVAIAVLLGDRSPNALLAALGAGHLCALIVVIGSLYWRLRPYWTGPTKEGMLNIMRNTLPFGIFIVANRIVFRVPEVIMSLWWNQAVVGVYLAAARLIDLAEQLPALAAAAVYPRIALKYHELKDVQSLVDRTARVVIAAGVTVAVTLVLAPAVVLGFVYGHRFAVAAAPLTILGAVLPLRYAIHVFGVYLSGSPHQWTRTAATVIGAAVLTFTSILLVPTHGAVGAAFAVGVTSACIAGITGGTTIRYLRLSLRRILWSPALVALAAVLTGMALPGGPLAQAFGAMLCAVGLLFATRVVDTSELRQALAEPRE